MSLKHIPLMRKYDLITVLAPSRNVRRWLDSPLLKLTVDIFKMDKRMSQKEVKRAQVLDLLKRSKISRQEASNRKGIGARQVKRLAECYPAEGIGGLVSKKQAEPQTECWIKLCAPQQFS